MKVPATAILAAAAVVPLAAVGTALITQHVWGMQPCAWCVLQRLIFVTIAITAGLGLLVRQAWLRRAGAAVILALAGCGMSAALWQHFVAARSASCNLTFADRVVGGLGLDGLLPQVFAAYATCADAAVKLLGVPYEFYSLTLFVVLGALAVQVLRRPL